MKIATILFSISMLLNTTSFAQAGSLDSSFGDNGKIIARISRYCSASAVAIQPDGKILVAGTSDYDFLVLRYKKNGFLDKTFGNEGVVLTDFGGTDIAASMALQPDGKIILAGVTGPGTADNFALARYQQDGTLDSSFGLNGKVVTDFGESESGRSVVLQADGKIVLAGASGYGPAENFALVRYKKSGRIDSSFGTNGEVITNLAGSDNHLSSAAIQPNGKIVVAGSVYTRYSDHPKQYFALARYQDNGVLDDSFGGNGKVLTDFGDASASSIAIQKDGRLVVAGVAFRSPNAVALARYRRDGKLDSSFGKDGKVVTQYSIGADASSVATQTDGKIVAAGGLYQSFALLRYKSNGSIDKSFGVDGLTTTSFSSWAISNGRSVAIQNNGKIVVVGQVYYDFSFVAVARYNGDNTSPLGTIASSSNAQKNENAIGNIVLSPNPVKDILHIDLGANITGSSLTKTISIIDAKGKLLQQVATQNNSYSFNVKQLSAGIYLVRIVEADKTTTLIFIKE